MLSSSTMSIFSMALVTPMFLLQDNFDVFDDAEVLGPRATKCQKEPPDKPSIHHCDADSDCDAESRASALAGSGWPMWPSPWHFAMLAAMGVAEAAVSIIALLRCVHRRRSGHCQGAESSTSRAEADLRCSSSTVCDESRCQSADVDGSTLEEEVEQLVAENKALRKVVNAAWLGNNIDIWDFEKKKMQNDDVSEAMSDKSTCDDQQASLPSSFSIADPEDLEDEGEDFMGFEDMEGQGQTRDDSTSEGTKDSSPCGSCNPPSMDLRDDMDLRDEGEDEDDKLIRIMQWQMATGKWQNEDDKLIQTMFARW